MSLILEEKVNNTEGEGQNGESGAADAGEEGSVKKRGRPKKKDTDESPLTPEPPPRAKKRPEDIKQPYAAINRCHAEMVAHVANLREMHPETEVGDAVNPLDVKKEKLGAPIEKTAFHAPIIGLCKLAGWVGNLEPEELPKQEQYDRCAESWAKTSTHLGLKEKTAALFSSISETVYVVGFTAGKAIKKVFFATPTDDRPVEQVNDVESRPSAPAPAPEPPKEEEAE
jgi:hypothetical protein